MDKVEPINSFEGEHHFLSNFHHAEVIYDGLLYPTTEHAYQAAKTLDLAARRKIRECGKPNTAKGLGRKVKMRPGWESMKLSVMEDLVRQKFTSHKDLQDLLLETGDRKLVEGNWWKDMFWGTFNGVGQNHLGKILMKVRAELKVNKPSSP
jgi:N-glycosidase YbiA